MLNTSGESTPPCRFPSMVTRKRSTGSGARSSADSSSTSGWASSEQDGHSLIGDAIHSLVGKVPTSTEQKRRNPAEDARAKANSAAAKAALAAGALALPPGVMGWLTILPEMMSVWKIQRQLVADLAAIYGKTNSLTPEQMVYCLFQHTAAGGVRDLVVRVGERTLVRRASPRVIGAITRRIGATLAKRTAGKGLARWIPIAGAVGMGAYAYFDTAQVASTAIDLFEGVIEVEAVETDTHDALPK